jgi:predicted nucleic acid-binding protein
MRQRQQDGPEAHRQPICNLAARLNCPKSISAIFKVQNSEAALYWYSIFLSSLVITELASGPRGALKWAIVAAILVAAFMIEVIPRAFWAVTIFIAATYSDLRVEPTRHLVLKAAIIGIAASAIAGVIILWLH